MHICFLHPDLGIGGAERLVVDAAVALKCKGHYAYFITNHHDETHCFDETKDGTLDVTVVCDWLPRHIFGKLHALLAYIRMLLAAFYICIYFNPDIIFCDQVAVAIPVFRLFKRSSRVMFYCHFPDQLLTNRTNIFKKIYRFPLDWAEQYSTGLAHCVMVNSQFTANVFRQTFPSLSQVNLQILYPTLNTSSFSGPEVDFPMDLLPARVTKIFLSLNRYERKKNIKLAIRALGIVRGQVSPDVWNSCHLIIAGGYDSRVSENVHHYKELVDLTDELELTDHVTFLQSPSETAKRALLSNCLALLYTPSNEHFGIVPIEAMYSKRPVIAVNSGGPLETIIHNETGLLCNPRPADFAQGMKVVLENDRAADQMGLAGRERVEQNFLFDAFSDQLNKLCKEVIKS